MAAFGRFFYSCWGDSNNTEKCLADGAEYWQLRLSVPYVTCGMLAVKNPIELGDFYHISTRHSCFKVNSSRIHSKKKDQNKGGKE